MNIISLSMPTLIKAFTIGGTAIAIAYNTIDINNASINHTHNQTENNLIALANQENYMVSNSQNFQNDSINNSYEIVHNSQFFEEEFISSNWKQQQIQETTISLNVADLNEPHILTINSSGSKLNGEIKLNGKVIETISKKETEIDLSSQLKKGKNIIEISGNYTPNSSLISVEFITPVNELFQEVGGSGEIHQKIIIDVQ